MAKARPRTRSDSHCVSALAGRVVAAVEQDEVGERTDFVIAGFDEGEAHIAGLVIDTGKIFRHAAVGGGDHDDAGVGELIHLAVGSGDADVVKAGGLGQISD